MSVTRLPGNQRYHVQVHKIANRDGWVCFYCECPLNCGSPPSCKHKDRGPEDGQQATRDHLVPQSQGGLTTLLNQVIACRKCNNTRKSDDWQEFKAGVARFDQTCYTTASAGWEQKVSVWG